jgi:hypothetical protein
MKSTIDLINDEFYQIDNFIISFDEVNKCLVINSVNPRDVIIIEPVVCNSVKIHSIDYRKWKDT